MAHIPRREDLPKHAINEPVLQQGQVRPSGDMFAGRKKVPLCIWRIDLGTTTQTFKGDDEVPVSEFKSVPQWNRFFTGREVVVVTWLDDEVLRGAYDEITSEQILEGGDIIMNTSSHTTTIYLSPEETKKWKDEYNFALFSLPSKTGAILYVPESITRKIDEDEQYWYTEIVLVEVNSKLNLLDDERREQYIHYGAPNQNYVTPNYIESTDEIDKVLNIAEQVHSVQLDFFGIFMLGGFFFSDGTTDKMIVSGEALEPQNSELYRTQTIDKPLVYVTKAGINYQGQWSDWQDKVKDKYDLQVRPVYEGVLTYDSAVFSTGLTTDSTATIYKVKVGGKLVGDPIIIRSVSGATANSPDTNYISIEENFTRTWNKVEANILKSAFDLLGGSVATIEEVTAATKIGNTDPLYGTETFAFNYEFNQTNIQQTISATTFTSFLAGNSIANMDTPQLPIEITENKAVNISTLPIIGGFTFGIPLGFSVNVNRTTAGYYDRKYNLIIPKTLFLMLSEGVYGVGDNRIALEAFKENYNSQLISADSMTWGIRTTLQYITKGTGTFTSITSKKTLEYMVLQGIGICDVRIRFFNVSGESVWSAFVRTQSSHTKSLVDWQTIISLKV